MYSSNTLQFFFRTKKLIKKKGQEATFHFFFVIISNKNRMHFKKKSDNNNLIPPQTAGFQSFVYFIHIIKITFFVSITVDGRLKMKEIYFCFGFYTWSFGCGRRTRAAPSCCEPLTTEPLRHPPCLMRAPSLKTDPV